MITLRIWDYMFPCQCAHVSYAGGKKMYFAHCSSNVSSCFAVGASRRSYLFWPWNRTWIRPYCARPVGFLMIGPLVFYVCSLMSERTYFQNVFLFKSGWPYLVPFFSFFLFSTSSGDPAGARLKPGSGYGHGFGIRVDSPLGPLGLEYAFNDRQTRRFHFGVGHPN